MPRSVFPFARRSVVLGSALIAVIATTAATTAATSRPSAEESAFRHTRLLRSLPTADSVIKASPTTVQLWFSEKIELGLSRVRVIDAAGKSVSIAPLTQDATKANAPVVGRVPTPLADGVYTVNWTAASADGHAVKGTFNFTIRSR